MINLHVLWFFYRVRVAYFWKLLKEKHPHTIPSQNVVLEYWNFLIIALELKITMMAQGAIDRILLFNFL